jgi:hypothetical protein
MFYFKAILLTIILTFCTIHLKCQNRLEDTIGENLIEKVILYAKINNKSAVRDVIKCYYELKKIYIFDKKYDKYFADFLNKNPSISIFNMPNFSSSFGYDEKQFKNIESFSNYKLFLDRIILKNQNYSIPNSLGSYFDDNLENNKESIPNNPLKNAVENNKESIPK